MITQQERQNKLKETSKENRYLYGSLELAKHIKKVREKYSIPESPIFVHLIGDTILGFHILEELPHLLSEQMNIDESRASSIASEFVEILSSTFTNSTQNKGVENSLSSARIENAEDPTVQPLRTMEGDMDKIHGYGAYRKMYPDAPQSQSADVQTPSTQEAVVHATSQDDTLAERPPLAPIPTYDKTQDEEATNTNEEQKH